MDKQTRNILIVVGIIVLFIFLSNNNFLSSVYTGPKGKDCDSYNLNIGDCYNNHPVRALSDNYDSNNKVWCEIDTDSSKSCGSSNCKESGALCTSDSICCSGYYCNDLLISGSNGICALPQPIDGTCSRNVECLSGKCQNNKCVTSGSCQSSGKLCYHDSECCSGLNCKNNKCTSLSNCQTCPQLGKECGFWDDGCGNSLNCGSLCPSGKECSQGKCVSSSGCNIIGSNCNQDSDCCSNKCAASGKVGWETTCVEEIQTGDGKPVATQLSLTEKDLSEATSDTIMSATCSLTTNCLPYEDINGDKNYTIKCKQTAILKQKIKEAAAESCKDSFLSKLLSFKIAGPAGIAACAAGIAIPVTMPTTIFICGAGLAGSVAIGSAGVAYESGCEIFKQNAGNGLCIASSTGGNGGFCIDIANTWLSGITKTSDCQTNTIVLIIIVVLAFVLIMNLSKR